MLSLLLALLAAPPEDMAARVSRPVALRVPGMEKVRIQRDLVYDPGAGLRLDAYAPPRSGRYPVVVLLHGGVPDEVPVRPKDWGLYRSWGRLLAASGFATVIPNQRISFPDPRLVLAEQDVANAIAFIRGHASKLSADASRVCMVAFSAGGPLLAKFIREHPSEVRCLAAMYAFLDIRQSDPHRQHLSPAQLDQFSPLVQMERSGPGMAPIFVARAGNDEIPTLRNALDQFVSSALAHDAPLQLVNVPGIEHGFEIDDDPRVRDTLRSLLRFLAEHLEPR
jgi:acetyl esterase/lipase